MSEIKYHHFVKMVQSMNPTLNYQEAKTIASEEWQKSKLYRELIKSKPVDRSENRGHVIKEMLDVACKNPPKPKPEAPPSPPAPQKPVKKGSNPKRRYVNTNNMF